MKTRVSRVAWVPVAVLLAALSLSGCGAGSAAPDRAEDDRTATAQSEPSTPAWLSPDGGVLVTCGPGPAFPATTAAEGGLDVGADQTEEIVTALAELKESAGMETPVPLQQADADEVKWAVLWWEQIAGKEAVGLLLAPPESTGVSLESDWHLVLERQDGRLKVIAWGDTCGARPALPADSAWAQITLPAQAPTPQGTTVDVLVSEIDCTSGRDPEPFLAAEPVIVETDTDVTVYWTTDRLTEAASCPGNPSVERTLQLDRPLGQRTLQDGSTWPPAPVTSVDGP